ncbi:hypothetical protein A7J42_21315 [Brucella intermedia]|nr:hypothetical protein A7J42_21315 [Brucella intermedia]
MVEKVVLPFLFVRGVLAAAALSSCSARSAPTSKQLVSGIVHAQMLRNPASPLTKNEFVVRSALSELAEISMLANY